MMGGYTVPQGYRHPLQSSEAELSLSLSRLPAPLAAIASAPIVSVTTADHPSVPEEIASKVRSSGHGYIPSATNHADDGSVHVMIGDARGTDLNHEMIHAAQVFASEKEMGKAFDAVAFRGERILMAVEGAKATGEPDDRFGDVDSALRMTVGAAPGKDDYMMAWDLFKDIHHGSRTRELGAMMGFDAQETGAAIFAAGLKREGYAFPTTHVARELVAYSFQRDPMQIASLLNDAAPKAMAAKPLPPRAGEFSIDEARAAVAGLPDCKDGAVPLWVTKRDLDILTIRNREGLKEPYPKALLDVLPAIKQPSFDVSDGKMVRNGKFDLGHQGALALYKGFGENSTRRRMWLDAEKLAHRLVHLEQGGKAAFSAASQGSAACGEVRAAKARREGFSR